MKLNDLLKKNPEWEKNYTNGQYIKNYDAVRPMLLQDKKYEFVSRINNVGLGCENHELESAWFREIQETLGNYGFILCDKSIPLAQNDGCQAKFAVKDTKENNKIENIIMGLFEKYVYATPDFLSRLLAQEVGEK